MGAETQSEGRDPTRVQRLSQPLPSPSLDEIPWVSELQARPGVVRIETTSVIDPTLEIDPDHLFLSMRREGLLRDLRFLWDAEGGRYHVVLALGDDVAGHPRITHGGLTAATIDETTGCLVLESKRAGSLPPGRAFTAHLELDYKAPLPVGVVVLCTAEVESVERRKIWTRATLRDGPDGTVYATGRALYVTVRGPEEEAKAPTSAAAAPPTA